jgi:hypothetical protein
MQYDDVYDGNGNLISSTPLPDPVPYIDPEWQPILASLSTVSNATNLGEVIKSLKTISTAIIFLGKKNSLQK